MERGPYICGRNVLSNSASSKEEEDRKSMTTRSYRRRGKSHGKDITGKYSLQIRPSGREIPWGGLTPRGSL